MRLDCGCGNHPVGDVNVDLRMIRVKCVFVRADIYHLPFPNNSFSEVYSHYLLPYVKDAKKAIEEMLRVTCGSVRIWIPHRFSATARHQRKNLDFNIFNRVFFSQCLQDLYQITEDEVLNFIKIVVNYEFLRLGKLPIPLLLPSSLWIQIWKPRNMPAAKETMPHD